MRVLAALLVLILSGASVAELRVAPSERLQPASAGSVSKPLIAASADGFLVAWIDHRPPAQFDWRDSDGHIRGMRLDMAGERIDDRDFEIAPLTQDPWHPMDLASDGRDYLVMHPLTTTDGRDVIRVLLVPAERGERARVVNEIAGYAWNLDLTWTGTHYAAVISGRLYLLDRMGSIEHSVELALNDSNRDLRILGTTDGQLLLANEDSRGISVALVSTDDLMRQSRLKWLLDAVLLPARTLDEPLFGITRGESGFALLMTNGGSSASVITLDAYGRNPSPRRKLEAPDFVPFQWWSIERLGTGYVAVATGRRAQYEDSEILLYRLRADGTLLDFRTITTWAPWIATARGAIGTAMLAYALERSTIRVQRLSLAGTTMLSRDGVVASMSRPTQEDARVARCANFDAVVWREPDDSSNRLLLRRFAHDGRPLGRAVELDRTLDRFSWPRPAITCGRTTALVHWSGGGIRAVLIDAKSAPRPFPVPRDVHRLATIFDGATYVGVVNGPPVRLIRWTEQGVQTAEARHDALPIGFYNALGWNGAELLLIAEVSSRLHGFRFGADLAFRGATEVIAEPDPDRDESYFDVAVVGSPGDWLIGWNASGNYGFRIPMTARVSRTGTLLDPPGGVRTGGLVDGGMRQLSWNGSQWELLTRDHLIARDPDGAIHASRATGREGIVMQAITASGESRLLVYQRVEPVDGVHELYVDTISADAWDRSPRRRASRH